MKTTASLTFALFISAIIIATPRLMASVALTGPISFTPITAPCQLLHSTIDTNYTHTISANTSRTITVSGALSEGAGNACYNVIPTATTFGDGVSILSVNIALTPGAASGQLQAGDGAAVTNDIASFGANGAKSVFAAALNVSPVTGNDSITLKNNSGSAITVDLWIYAYGSPQINNAFTGHSGGFEIVNNSTTCSGNFGHCGLSSQIYSTSNLGGKAIVGVSNGTGSNYVWTGVWGEVSDTYTGSRGTYGTADAATGATYGVEGLTSSASNNAAGVFGNTRGDQPWASDPGLSGSAVRGESNSGFGVVGISQGVGVGGYIYNTSGAYKASGYLGYYNGSTWQGVYSIGNFIATGTKSFVEPHPTDPSKEIKFVSLEGPESGTYFRGSGQIVNGFARIDVPESFRLVTDSGGLTVQLTPVGTMAVLAVVSQDLNSIVVQGSQDVAFNYMANGVRKAYRDFQAIQPSADFMPQSATESTFGAYAPEIQQRLVASGIYNSDGSVNMATARTLGWDQVWAARDAERAAAAQHSHEVNSDHP